MSDCSLPPRPRPTIKGLHRLSDGVDEATREMDRFEAGDFSSRVPTGIPSLDIRLRGGLAPGQLTLLGAPSGGGKTTALVQLCCAVAKARGGVLLISPEMSVAELAEREIVRRAERELWDRNPWRSNPERRDSACKAHTLASVAIKQEKLPVYVLDRPDVTMSDVEDTAEAIHGLRLVAIDYAQQVASLDPHTPRYLEVGAVATRSIALAMRLKIPVLVASQVNVIRDAHEPTRYAFRESAILDHKAHNVLILEVEWDEAEGQRFVKDAKVVCTKQRSGPAFRLPVTYDPRIYAIGDANERTQGGGRSQMEPLPYA